MRGRCFKLQAGVAFEESNDRFKVFGGERNDLNRVFLVHKPASFGDLIEPGDQTFWSLLKKNTGVEPLGDKGRDIGVSFRVMEEKPANLDHLVG